jgi:hypothetical protein
MYYVKNNIITLNKYSSSHQQSDEIQAWTELRLLGLQVIFSSFFVLIASVLGESKLSNQTPLGVLGV